MKKILLIIMALALVGGTAVAQKKPSGGKKKASPYISGKQKLREQQPDCYDFNRFTPFSTKDLKRYYTPFDYTKIPTLTQKPAPDWGLMQPVMNYLTNSSRATMTVCALYAVNPDIEDIATHDRLAKEAAKEAYNCLQALEAWKVKREMRNKIQYQVAEIDYRYFKGANYYNAQTSDEVIHVGLLLYFGSKKKAMFDVDTNTRTFPDIKFFPNDANIVDSWNTVLDELSDYLKENDRKSVLLTGYSDSHGTDAYCIGVSRQRAMEVKKALVIRGIDENRIEVEAKGDADPVGDNDDKEAYALNNRVSIKIQ